MNHIAKLTQDNADKAKTIASTQREINEFLAFLQTSPKFQGTASDGSRKDWIATGDVIARLQDIRSTLLSNILT